MSWTRTRPACFEELLTDAKDTVNASVRKSRLGSNILHLNRTDRSSVSHKSIEYLHRDHLGSVEAVTNESGNVVRAFGFDPFGERRHEDWNRQLSPSEIDSTADEARTGTTRGYTGHENLDRTGLVHMNGRIYDPQTGRFLSPDPVVQAPGYSQSWNRYSYVMGNPVSFNDPSGYVTAGPLCGAGSLALCANSNDQANGMGTSQFTVAFPTTTITASGYVEVGMETVSAIVSSPAWGAMREGQRPSAAITYYSVPTYTYRYSFTSNTVDNPTQIEIPESGQTDEPMGESGGSFGAHDVALLFWPGYDLGTCISQGNCSGGEWILAGVGVIPGGKGAAVGGKGLLKVFSRAPYRPKPINLPSWKKIDIDMDHIASGHIRGGSRVSSKKDLFPDHMTRAQVEKAVREAYRYGKRIETQGDRVRVRGNGIEMWVNIKDKAIETAYPVK